MVTKPKRFDIYYVNLDPTIGSEIQKTRPAVVISPNEINEYLHTIIVAPMTTAVKDYPTRVSITFQSKNGFIALDQIRTVDKQRLVKKIGTVDSVNQTKIITTLLELFAL